MSQTIKRLAITMGEPAGIGPELLVRLAQQSFDAEIVALAEPALLERLAVQLDLPLQIVEYESASPPVLHQAGQLKVKPVVLPADVNTGELNSANSQAVLDMLETAGKMALKGEVDAIVTAPVHKAILNQSHSDPAVFSGHTEFFANLAGVEKVVMMLATDDLRIGLATTHLPLADVSKAISNQSLRQILTIVDHSFQQLGMNRPKIGVCGLNPHAGEDGVLGREEIELIIPTLAELKAEGLRVEGPFPADSLFTASKRKRFDFCLAMYHDQGLPVVKALGFGRCANITLGLPFIRTSVDHGTALDIANRYQADESSLIYATHYALALTEGRLPIGDSRKQYE